MEEVAHRMSERSELQTAQQAPARSGGATATQWRLGHFGDGRELL
jgi:hypothetical protein